MSREMLMANPDFALIAACVRPLADPARVAAIAHAASVRIDADRVATLAHRHRIEGFVEQGLSAAGIALPEPAATTLKAGAARARLQALRNAGEELRVGQALAAAGIDALFVKGATTAMLAHGALGLKASWDIDVLVSRAEMYAAGEVLVALGYRLRVLGGIDDPVQVRRFLAGNKEADWINRERGITVELHTELCDLPKALPTVGLKSPRQTVALMAGQGVQTLAADPLFAYLAYHGTAHLWARLKWLADVAALLQGDDVTARYASARALGAGRTPGVAIVLAHELLGLAVPSALLDEIRADRLSRRLIASSRAAMRAGQDADGRLMRVFREAFSHTRAQGWLLPGFAQPWHAAARYLTRPYSSVHLRVPRWAVPVAIIGALPIRLATRARRHRRERAQSAGNTASRP